MQFFKKVTPTNIEDVSPLIDDQDFISISKPGHILEPYEINWNSSETRNNENIKYKL